MRSALTSRSLSFKYPAVLIGLVATRGNVGFYCGNVQDTNNGALLRGVVAPRWQRSGEPFSAHKVSRKNIQIKSEVAQ